MVNANLLEALDSLGHPRTLVLGDVVLDRYTWGNAERVSQEAPVILLRADQREARLGGAANVCHMLRGLEAEVTCAGIVGGDSEGEFVRRLLTNVGVHTDFLFVDQGRPTTVKERFIGRAQGRHPHQMLRVDSEVRDAIGVELEARLAESIAGRIGAYEMLFISDYDKGVCTPALLGRVIESARAAGVKVLVDPIRSSDYSRYRGASGMTPNRTEAEIATGIRIASPEDAFQAGRKLCLELGLELCVVTLDRDGMALVFPDGRSTVYPTRPRAVYDITGAGDMALAMIGVCLAGGIKPPQTIRLANIAAGLEVEKVGVAVIPRQEIRSRLVEEYGPREETARLGSGDGPPATAPTNSVRRSYRSKVVALDELARLAGVHRARSERMVLTNGVFDLLHVGHVGYLAEARELGDILVVAINSDASVRRLKGPTRPVIRQNDRATMLAALGMVDYVLIFHEDTPHEVLRELKPDVLVKGGTYTKDEVVGHEVVEAYGGTVCVTGRVEGMSTTGILGTAARQQALAGPHFSAIAVRAGEEAA